MRIEYRLRVRLWEYTNETHSTPSFISVTGSLGVDVLLLDCFKAEVVVEVVEMGEVGLAGERDGDGVALVAVVVVVVVVVVIGDLLSLLFFTLPNVCSMAEIWSGVSNSNKNSALAGAAMRSSRRKEVGECNMVLSVSVVQKSILSSIFKIGVVV